MKKEIGIGFLTGLIINCLGVIICAWIVGYVKGSGWQETLEYYWASGNFWMLITLGALPNLAAFFGFLKLNRDYRARGVLLATFVAAISSYLIYFL